jgi:hypothetical protein
MNWQDVIYIGLIGIVWYVLVRKILPKLGVGT